MAATEFARLPLLTQTAYARLLDLLLTTEAGSSVAGSLVSKTIRGRRYWYAQRQDGDKKVQSYIGPETPEVLATIARWQQQRGERTSRTEIIAMARAGGAAILGAAEAQVLERLSPVFRVGGVLVGRIVWRVAFEVPADHRPADEALATEGATVDDRVPAPALRRRLLVARRAVAALVTHQVFAVAEPLAHVRLTAAEPALVHLARFSRLQGGLPAGRPWHTVDVASARRLSARFHGLAFLAIVRHRPGQGRLRHHVVCRGAVPARRGRALAYNADGYNQVVRELS